MIFDVPHTPRATVLRRPSSSSGGDETPALSAGSAVGPAGPRPTAIDALFESLPAGLVGQPWALRRNPSGIEFPPDGAKSADADTLSREAIGDLLDQVVDPEVARIHPTWFLPAEPENLPESLLDFLPRNISDRVRLLAGPTLIRGDLLPKPLALELARTLWGHLSPAEPVSRLGKRLWALSSERLEAVLERAGVELVGSLLALVPERSAAALCRMLPPIQARTLWIARKAPAFPASSSWIKALSPIVARGTSLQLIRRFSLALLASALAAPPEDRDRIRRRLYRTWCCGEKQDPRSFQDPVVLPPLDKATGLFERLLSQEEAARQGQDDADCEA